MTHHHLGFEITHGIKRNADHNQYRGTAERDINPSDRADNDRKNGDHA